MYTLVRTHTHVHTRALQARLGAGLTMLRQAACTVLRNPVCMCSQAHALSTYGRTHVGHTRNVRAHTT